MPTFPSTLIGKWPWFAVGLGLAVARAAWGSLPMAERPRPVRIGPAVAWAWWGAAAAVLLFSAYGGVLPRNAFALTPAQSQLELLLFALFALCLVGPVVLGDGASGRGPAAALVLAPVVWLGTVSYGIFLWHFPLALWASERYPDDHWVFAAVTCALALAGAAFSWYVVERPLMRRGAGGRRAATLTAVEAGEAAP
jgi:peptidoglycan/LPS O-acetylase OafA/YrhL